MSNEYLKKLSNELKETREKSKVTIDQIFTKTRIDRKYLSAIENGNFSVMPEVYIRAFIREYAKSIGLDATETLNKYEKAKSGQNYNELPRDDDNSIEEDSSENLEPNISKGVIPKSKSGSPEDRSQSNKTLYYSIGSIAMLLFIFIIYKVFLNDQRNELITEKPFDEIVQEQNNLSGSIAEQENIVKKTKQDSSLILPQKVEKISSNENLQKEVVKEIIKQPVREGELTLTIIGDDKSWLRVVADEKNNVEFTIDKDVTKVLYAKEKFYLHIGNSGGVKLLLNNKDIFFSGTPGKVRKIFVTQNGIEYLRRTPTLSNEQE